MCILNVHYFIADIVGRLHKIDQRIARIGKFIGVSGRARYAQFVGNPQIVLALSTKKAEFGTLAGQMGRAGILDDGSQRRIGHHETATAMSVELMSE